MRKIKGYDVGVISYDTEELDGVSISLLDNLDETICIILRDLIRHHVDLYDHYPYGFIPEDVGYFAFQCDLTYEEQVKLEKKWKKVRLKMANEFDSYLKKEEYEEKIKHLKRGLKMLYKWLPDMVYWW